MSVLIVDDSLTVRMDLLQAFEMAGIASIPCANAAEARAALSIESVDVIVLDVLLPDADGVELLGEIRAGPYSDIPVMMLSTEAEIGDRVRGLRTGADEYVGKPYDSGYVVARAQEMMRLSAAPTADITTVLVIDDSQTFREELRRFFEQEGYRVLTADNGEEGLRVAASQRPDAAVVDAVLPDIDGATIIRRFRLDAALRYLPCVLLTASEDRDVELRALDAGADTFVRKESGSAALVLAKLAVLLRGAAQVAQTDDGSSLSGPKKILAVDDSMTFLNEVSERLRAEGYDVVQARSGEEALDLLAVQMVDCILLDLLMPGIGGQETCRRIKDAPILRDVPLIMLTALEDRSAMIDAFGVGADDYISKSSEIEVLTARIRAQLRRKQFEDENRRFRDELLRREIEATEARAAADLAETRAMLVGELERKNRELEAFSYSVSHDLRAPLRSVDGFSQALLEDYAELLDDTAKDYLSRVRSAAQRMGCLIDDLLSLSRVGRRELHRELVDLAEIATDVVVDLTKSDPERHVKVDIRDDLVVSADPGLMRAALENLIGNAWKFTAKVDDAVIEVAAEVKDGVMTYFVRDNGDGFDMNYAEKLFSPFQRLHTEEDFPGTGIGLATVHRIIDRHGGRVWAEGDVGHGATFHFTLPEDHSNVSKGNVR